MFFAKLIFKNAINWYLLLLSIFSFFLYFYDMSFIENLLNVPRCYILLSMLALLPIICIMLFIYGIYKRDQSLKINNNTVNIKIGDIFNINENKEAIRIIPSDEHFFSTVDDIVVSKSSLIGQAISKNYIQKDKLPNDLNNKKKLGTIISADENKIFYALALTRIKDYDSFNAYLTMQDLTIMLMNFWYNLNKIYNGKEIIIPILASGITRITDNKTISHQELLNLMLSTLKLSKESFNSNLNIFIYKKDKNKINFYTIGTNNGI